MIKNVETLVPVRELQDSRIPLVAHTPPRADSAQWHSLRDHLLQTSRLAQGFAEPFGGGSVARFAGMIHDAGKATAQVQCALRAAAVDQPKHLGVPHKGEGAELAYLVYEHNQQAGLIVCGVNYGHHSGIPDHLKPIDLLREMRSDSHRLDGLVAVLDDLLGVSIRQEAARVTLPQEIIGNKYCLEMFTRMCHSALVDADFLDTDQHFRRLTSPQLSVTRGIKALGDTFFSTYASKYSNSPSSDLNILRSELFDHAVRCAREPHESQIFRLPAQTGMGKTMAAAAFALEHAYVHGKKRVIVAVPYTSITTQNAEAYRKMFADLGSDVVLEHHSNIYDDRIADDSWRRFAAANWDSEFVVTTTVQLFDSLFSNKPSKTRKLHRLANSVLIIDEVQALPRQAVPAILRVLRELAEHFGLTVVLASATQPSFWRQPEWKDIAFTDIAPLDEVPKATVRVDYEVRQGHQSWEEIAGELTDLPQVLAVVNTTSDAQALYRLVHDQSADESSTFHLSTRMCGQHRADVLRTVRDRLEEGRPTRLISTQVIEAGVDVDFPVVFRALGPADSVIQSAGRCNREGKMAQRGRVVVFQPEDGACPPGDYASDTAQTRSLFVDTPDGSSRPRGSFSDPESMRTYYDQIASMPRDTRGMAVRVEEDRLRCDFDKTRKDFHMIDSDTCPVLVTDYGPPEDREAVFALLNLLGSDPGYQLTHADRNLITRYTVSLAPWYLSPGQAEKLCGLEQSGAWHWIGDYDSDCGIIPSRPSKEATIW